MSTRKILYASKSHEPDRIHLLKKHIIIEVKESFKKILFSD